LVNHLSQTRAIQVSYPGLVSATAGVRIEVVLQMNAAVMTAGTLLPP